MPVADVLGPLQVLPLARAGAAAADGGAPSQSLSGFSVEIQQQSEWCWAAVSSSVASFFGSSAWTQCSIASGELAPLNCCGGDASDGCNQPWYLDRALTRVGHFDHIAASDATFAVVQGEINGGRPLGCRIAWAGGSAHFVALGGWSVTADGSQYVMVCDPYYGPTTKKYADFVSAYMTTGDSWTHSYFTGLAGNVAAAGGAAPDPNSPKSC
ncbi:papain-like cysteine protease family protein [Bradyrhizobium sp. UFLA05-109]